MFSGSTDTAISLGTTKKHVGQFRYSIDEQSKRHWLSLRYAGLVSCKGEAQARAVRAKNYMTKIRHADWNRIIWRNIGYGDEFHVSIWLAPRGTPPLFVPDYERSTAKHVIKDCGSNPMRELDRPRRRA